MTQRAKLRCPRCETVFSIPAAATSGEETPSVESSSEKTRRRKRIPRKNVPSEISWRWKNYVDNVGVVIFLVLTGLFVIVMMKTAISDQRFGVRVFCILFATLLTLPIYRLLISMVNRTTLQLQGETLHFRDAPFPWFRRRHFSLSGVTAVVTEKDFIQTVYWKGNETDQHRHTVVAVFEGGRRESIIGCQRDEKLAGRIQKFIAASFAEIEPLRVQSTVSSVDPSVRSVVFNDDDLDRDSLAEVDTSSAQSEWAVSATTNSWSAVRRWYSPFTAVSLLILGGGPLICVFFAIANSDRGPLPLEAWIPMAVGLFVLLACIYTGITLLVNSTEINWEDGELRQRHFPLPWIAPKPLLTENIAGFEVERKIRVSGNNHNRQTDFRNPRLRKRLKKRRSYQYEYIVWVQLEGGEKTRFYRSYRKEDAFALQNILRRKHRSIRRD